MLRAPGVAALSSPQARTLRFTMWLTEKIKQIDEASRGVYGTPRIHAELRLEHDVRVGRKRVARLMKAAGISGIRPHKRFKTTIRIPGITPATDLVERQSKLIARTFCGSLTSPICGPARAGCTSPPLRRVLPSDRRLVDGDHMRASLVVDALKMAIARRRPEPGLIHHSDQGGQPGLNPSSQQCLSA